MDSLLHKLFEKKISVSWWLSGGIEAANCFAAYRPRGAASLAASYNNLNNPGTNNAVVGNAPTWNAANGWIFDGIANYLITTFVAQNDQSQSVLIRFSTITNEGLIFGAYQSATNQFRIRPNFGGNVFYYHGQSSSTTPVLLVGNVGIAGNRGYRNGIAEGSAIGAYTGTPTIGAYIGCQNNAGVAGAFIACYIHAFAIYDTVLSAAQMLSVSTAMAAL